MSGRVVIVGGHTCDPSNEYAPGTLWQCDCGRYWLREQSSRWVQISVLDVALLQMNDAMLKARVERKRTAEYCGQLDPNEPRRTPCVLDRGHEGSHMAQGGRIWEAVSR